MTSFVDRTYLALLELVRAFRAPARPADPIDADARQRFEAEVRRAEAQALSALNRLKVM